MIGGDGKQLATVERWTMILALVAIAASAFTMSRPMALGVSLGAALMVLNTWALRRIGQRVLRTFARPGLAILLFNLKMGLLLGLVYVVVRYLPIDAIGFLVGVSVFPVAVVIAALLHAVQAPAQGEGDATPPRGDQ